MIEVLESKNDYLIENLIKLKTDRPITDIIDLYKFKKNDLKVMTHLKDDIFLNVKTLIVHMQVWTHRSCICKEKN